VLKGLAVVVAVGLTVYCLFDVGAADRRAVRNLPKPAWFVVVLVPLLGPAAWFLAGRAPRRRPGPQRPPPRVLGPDDDPDFLWRIERERERRNRRRGRPDDDPPPAPRT